MLSLVDVFTDKREVDPSSYATEIQDCLSLTVLCLVSFCHCTDSLAPAHHLWSMTHTRGAGSFEAVSPLPQESLTQQLAPDTTDVDVFGNRAGTTK